MSYGRFSRGPRRMGAAWWLDQTVISIVIGNPACRAGISAWVISAILETEELPDRGGAVTIGTPATNQCRELLLAMRRKIVLPARLAGETKCKP